MKDPVWLALVLGWLVWLAVFAPFVDRDQFDQLCLWLGGSFCLNLGIVSLSVPWLQRIWSPKISN